MENDHYKQVLETVAFLNESGFENPFIGIILGTGLSGFVKEIKIEKEISYF